jgi:hypothetical protein
VLIIADMAITDRTVSQENGHCSPSDVIIVLGVVCYTTLDVFITVRFISRNCTGQNTVPALKYNGLPVDIQAVN